MEGHKLSEKKRISNARYNAKCDCISVWCRKPVATVIRKAATDAGEPLQRYILNAVFTQMEKDGTPLQVYTTEAQK